MTKKILIPFTALFYSGIVLFSHKLFASEYIKNLSVGVGNKCNFFRTYQVNSKGDKNLCSFSPYINVHTDKIIYNQFSLSPEIQIGVPSNTKDGAATKLNSTFLINSKYQVPNLPIRYIAGLGLDINSYFAKGGTVVLQNGNVLEEFQLPSKNAHSANIVLNLGADYNFYKNYSANIYTHVFNIEDSQKRAFTLGLTLDINIGMYL